MNIWKVLAMLSIAALVTLLGIWAIDGFEIFTKTAVLVENYDELFDTTTEEWVDQFVLGLLPSGTTPKEICGVASLGAPFVLLLVLAFFKTRKPKAGQP